MVTIAPTPAMVVMAAAGIVMTLSGAAHPFMEPACHTAMGVLTVHATNAAISASSIDDRTIDAASLLATRLNGI